MEKEWLIIYTTSFAPQAEIIKGMLLENEIESVIISKQDSSYISFGEVELYVHQDDVIKAKHLINTFNTNE